MSNIGSLILPFIPTMVALQFIRTGSDIPDVFAEGFGFVCTELHEAVTSGTKHTIVDRGHSGANYTPLTLQAEEELASKARLHLNSIGLIERGQRGISLDTIIELAKAQRVKPAKLFEDF